MPYELFVGWRYLFQRRRSRAVWITFLAGTAVCGAGVAVFFLSGAKAVGAFLMLAGGLGMAAAALLAFFSTFTAISVLGVAIGVAILLWALSINAGFQEEWRRRVLGITGHVLVLKYGLDFYEYKQVVEKAEAVKGVEAAGPFVLNEMMIARGPKLNGVMVKGVHPRLVGRVLDLPGHIEGEKKPSAAQMSQLLAPSGPTGPPGIVVGRGLAEKLGLQVGDRVRLVSALSGLDVSSWTATGELPRSRDFRVNAIFSSGLNEYDWRLVYIHLAEAQSFFDHGDVVTGVDLKLHDPFAAKGISRRVLGALGGHPYRTMDWSEINSGMFRLLAIQKLFLFIFIGLIVVVAAFNVLAALVVLVIRKTREIAVLKSLGTSSGGVARIFMSSGVIVWFFGAGLGLLWGYLGGLVLARYRFPIDPKMYQLSELPVLMDPVDFLYAAVFAFFWCMLLTLYPSLRAARLQPVEGLRYE
jgi:lipoprotein-releasing system permease protein